MSIEWLDVIKLTVPFVSAILLVWIKSTIEILLSRRAKQRALSRLIADLGANLRGAVRMLRQCAQSASEGKVNLVTLDVYSVLPRLAGELSDLDPVRAYAYADLMSSAEVVRDGLSQLNGFVSNRICTVDNTVAERLARIIVAQSSNLSIDLISLGESGLLVVKAIPRGSRYQDEQGIKTIEDAISSAKTCTKKWPEIEVRKRGQKHMAKTD